MISPPPLTRAAALAAWADFLPHVGNYAERRNHVEANHGNVSRLSPALRHRLITEDEVIRDTLRHLSFPAAGKWLQEICWRRYWKGWLEMRPQVWMQWRQRVSELRATLPQEVLDKADAVAAGNSGVACMDLLARELVETGYLHNHARMWWASFWIHAERLPWELGADFFFRHLLDADPASNTLSWRWVAGLQTPGKSYIVRLSNLERFAHPASFGDRTGIHRIADGVVKPTPQIDLTTPTKYALPDYPTAFTAATERVGLWLHADDLSPEIGPLASLVPVAVAALSDEHGDSWLSANRLVALSAVVGDGLARSASHYRCPTALIDGDDPVLGLAEWATSHRLTQVVAFAPTVGPVSDLVPRLAEQLGVRDILLTLIRRPSDAHAFAMASAGFFPFWEKMSHHLQHPAP